MMGTERLYRSRMERMVAGVAGGLSLYFGIDPTIIRLFFVLAAIFSGGLAILAYLALWVFVPEEPYSFGAPPPFGEAPSFSGAPASTSAATGAAEGTGQSSGFGGTSEPAGVGGRGPSEAGNPFSSPGSFGSTDPFGSPGPFGSRRFRGEFGRRRGSGFGWALVILGALILASNLHLLSWLSMGVVWPLFLIGAGVLLLYRHGYLH